MADFRTVVGDILCNEGCADSRRLWAYGTQKGSGRIDNAVRRGSMDIKYVSITKDTLYITKILNRQLTVEAAVPFCEITSIKFKNDFLTRRLHLYARGGFVDLSVSRSGSFLRDLVSEVKRAVK